MSDILHPDNADSRLVGGRYELREELGSGGMASVYRAIEQPHGREVALKQLRVPANSRSANIVAGFEREFHTLAQLDHPYVITVYDYGISERGPYYTMELLDGGDVRERAPLPWRDACALFFDVCSSLALLHSRRLVHRDITPRNIRCTSSGRAKLIDFGAMAPIGTRDIELVGTPAFTAPETFHRTALDARTDLYSLGATLYFALTGQLARPGASFAEVMATWAYKPTAPSLLVDGIPAALDDLVLAMLSVEPALRPPSAFDVMQRLAAIGALQRDETLAVSAAYLATPLLVGREAATAELRAALSRALQHKGGAVLVRGAQGMGRSRLLDTCALAAKTLGFTVLRASASGDDAPFSVARELLEHLVLTSPAHSVLDANPEIFAADRPSVRALTGPDAASTDRTQQVICRALLDASRIAPLAIAVDDVQRADPQSAAVLAALIDGARRTQVLVVATAESDDEQAASGESLVLSVLARRSRQVVLASLSAAETRLLLSSVFGDVEHLDFVARELHAVSQGNPGETIELAQHLVDRALVTYSAGSWRLPSNLAASDLPASAEEALRAQLSGLSAQARGLAEAQALAYSEDFDQDAYRALRPDADAVEIDRALRELLRVGVVSPAGDRFTLSNRLWRSALLTQLDGATTRAHHRALAQLYAARSQSARIFHLFAGDEDALGLDEFHARHTRFEKGFDASVLNDAHLWKLLACYARAVYVAPRLGRSKREVSELRRWSLALSTTTDGTLYKTVGPAYFAQLRLDSGLDVWQDSSLADPGQRLTAALVGAQERYLATPEPERVYSVEESLHRLAEYVAFCIAVGVRYLDLALLNTLPGALEPFAPLSPLLDAIFKNALATQDMNCRSRIDQALALWREVLERLDSLSGTATTHLAAIQNAVAYGVGLLAAQLGNARAAELADRLDSDPRQHLSALQLRKLVALEQGDWAAAERFRRQAELASLHLRSLQMFRSLSTIELWVYAAAKDLAGIQHISKVIEPYCAQSPIWQLHALDAAAHFELARGDYTAACARFREGLAACVVQPDSDDALPQVWISLQAGLAEALLGQDQHAQARRCAAEAMRICEERGVGSLSHAIGRVLAQAEAASGDFARANARLDSIREQQAAAGASGLWVGLTFEAYARVAIASGAEDSFAHFAGLAATEYRHGSNSPLGARFERLLDEAQRRGFRKLPGLAAMSGNLDQLTLATAAGDSRSLVTRALSGAASREERCERALRLLCDTCNAREGHLFLIDDLLPRLAASLGSSEATPALLARVADYLAQQSHLQDGATQMLDSEQDNAPRESDRAPSYELMLLTSEPTIVAVAAIATGPSSAGASRPFKLLQALAAQLAAHGDDGSLR
jgi:hypothetical protein